MKRCIQWCAALAFALGLAGLAGCAGGSPVDSAGNGSSTSRSGVTVFGNIDAGVSHVR